MATPAAPGGVPAPSAPAPDEEAEPLVEGAGTPEEVPGAAFLAAAGRALLRPLTVNDRLFRLVFSFVLAAVFTLVMLYYTGGSLLYAMDYVGVYSWQDFFVRPRTDYVLPAVVSTVFGSHIYAAFYATTFLEAALIAFAMQTFCRALLRRSLSPFDLRVAGAIGAILYLSSPVLVTYRYVSLLQTIFPSSAAFLFVLAFFADAARDLRENVAFSYGKAALLGVALGFSGPDSLPNDARIVTIEMLLFLALLVLYLVIIGSTKDRTAAAHRTLGRVFVVSAPIGALLLAYPFYSFLTSGAFGLSTVSSVAGQFAPTLSSGPFNTLGLTIRLIGRRTFPATPYHALYLANPLVYGATYLWPILALVVPIFAGCVWAFKDRWLVLPLALVAAAGVLWEAGSNPPLGSVYTTVIGYLPYGDTFFQPYSITLLVISKIYPALMAFAIVFLARLVPSFVYPPKQPAGTPARFIPRWRTLVDPSGRVRRRAGARVIAAVLIVVLPLAAAMAALPVYNGAVEDGWVNTSQKGFFVPTEYRDVRQQLDAVHGSAVLLPEVSTYLRTSWGFNGASGFYQNYFAPSAILVPGFYGPYSEYLPSIVQNYSAATNPITAGPSSTLAPLDFGAAAIASPNSIGLRYTYPITANHALSTRDHWVDVNSTLWITLTFPILNASAMNAAVGAGNLWVGLYSNVSGDRETAWYDIGGGSNAALDALNATNLTVSVMPAVPSSGSVDTNEVGQVLIWVRQPVGSFAFVGGPPSVALANTSAVFASWLGQIRSYGMGYLLVDSSIVIGAEQPYSLVDQIVEGLRATGVIVPIHEGADLALYQIVAPPPELTSVR